MESRVIRLITFVEHIVGVEDGARVALLVQLVLLAQLLQVVATLALLLTAPHPHLLLLLQRAAAVASEDLLADLL